MLENAFLWIRLDQALLDPDPIRIRKQWKSNIFLFTVHDKSSFAPTFQIRFFTT